MYNIIYSQNSYNKLDSFIDGFSSTFLKMYTDTGIYDEKLICNSYIEMGDRFYDSILKKINDIFREETIYGFSTTSEKLLYTTISINNFRLFVYYSEDKGSKNRFIEDIEFYKR
ncbi:MAG: hypothetical protein GY828_08325 [Candidatus Gracilibacteria bacterium]|nr:hypothetical protein [Candidatus Gracilibacteria bacterium]